jgi:hypothetical protein
VYDGHVSFEEDSCVLISGSLRQACFTEGVQSEKRSKINLVDLAGSERFTQAGL